MPTSGLSSQGLFGILLYFSLPVFCAMVVVGNEHRDDCPMEVSIPRLVKLNFKIIQYNQISIKQEGCLSYSEEIFSSNPI
jgi:hypothetical protein